MSLKKIKLGIIGVGRMGITHYSIINSYPDLEIEAVADPSILILTLMKKFLPVKTFKDYNEMLEQTSLDALLVCTPPLFHFPIIRKAAELGIHVFVEKPFTTKMQEAAELAMVFKEKHLINQVGYVLRYNDCFIKSKQLLDDGVIGRVVRFRAEKYSSTITSSDEISGWRATRETGGGAVYEMASHAIDLIIYLIGKPDKIIGTSFTQIYSKKVEDAVSSTFIYKDGKSGYIDINWCDSSYRKPSTRVEIIGTIGKLIVTEYSIKIFLNEANLVEKFQKGWNTLYITNVFKNVPFYVRGNEFTRQLYDFIDNVVGVKESSLCTFDDGVKTHEVIESMFANFSMISNL